MSGLGQAIGAEYETKGRIEEREEILKELERLNVDSFIIAAVRSARNASSGTAANAPEKR